MIETKGILLAGVGGQGILRASDILCEVFISTGLDVKKSEVHGMAQRGGCVTSHVRYGQKVHSPLAKKNDIDILVSFEQMDTLRYLDYVKESGTIIINTENIFPPAVNLGEASYPYHVTELISHYFARVVSIDASTLALQAGNVRTVNTVLLGAISSILNLPTDPWEMVLQKSFSSKLIKPNQEAFRLGRSAV
ncbi:indolepyruvate oxidoreductase subunit beta [candidate division KSB1 bacterium]|nr:indolepyruvate oxidoreductase subunit beta [candidate division KSB1 bacterium]